MDDTLFERLRDEIGADATRRLLRLHAESEKLRFELADYQTRSRIVRAWLAAGVPAATPLASSSIPARIVQFWHAEQPPADVAELMATWRLANPEFAYEIYSDATALAFIRAQYPRAAADAFLYATHPALRSDLFRFLYLHRRGGIYVDADEECRHPIGDLLRTNASLLLAPRAWQFADRKEVDVVRAMEEGLTAEACGFYLNNAPIACRPAHPLVAAMVAFAVDRVLRAKQETRPAHVLDATSPQMFTETALNYLLGSSEPRDRFDDVGLLTSWHRRQATERWLAYKNTSDNWRVDQPNTPPPGRPATPAAQPQPAPRPPPPAPPPTPRPKPPPPALAPPPQPAPSVASAPAGAVSRPSPEPFNRIYRANAWGAGSGPGSRAGVTIEYRCFVERFITMNAISSILDIGCGDWQFSQFMNFAGAHYLGLDIVPEIIARNDEMFARDNVAFRMMPGDLTALPGADLVLIKDVLQHLPTEDIMRWREPLKKFPFCLITNSWRKLDTPVNTDIDLGGFRSLDLKQTPFDFPGAYVFEFWGEWESIRTLLVCN